MTGRRAKKAPAPKSQVPVDFSNTAEVGHSWVERYNAGERLLPRDPSRPKAVLGIDASLTGFALCLSVAPVLGRGETVGAAADLELQYDSAPGVTVRERIDRFRQLTWPVVELTRDYDLELVLIEGYATGFGRSKGYTQAWLSELGGILRHEVVDRTRAVMECAPATLKRWATGKGAGKKIAIATALAVENRRTFTDDNQADAYGLMQIAAATMGYVRGRLAHHRDVARSMQDAMRQAGYSPPPLRGEEPADTRAAS